MQPDMLKASIICKNMDTSTSIANIVRGMPNIEVQVFDSKYSVKNILENAADLIMVVLEEDNSLPEWLSDLTRCLPQTTVMICSSNQDKGLLLHAMQMGVREFIALPPDPADIAAAFERLRANKQKHPDIGSSSAGQMIAVAGLRGGVGTTAVAVNLAVHLAERYPRRVVIADLGRPFSNVAKFLDQDDMKEARSISDLVANEPLLDHNFILKILHPHEANLAVLHGPTNFNDLESVDPEVIQKIWTILCDSFDWVVVDLGHWLDEIYYNTIQQADRFLLITQITVPDLKNLRKLFSLLQLWDVPKEKVDIIVNRYYKDNGLKLTDLEAIQKKPVFFTLPNDFWQLNNSINDGVPLKEVAPRSKLCRSFQSLSEEVTSHRPGALDNVTSLQVHKARRRVLFF